MVVCTKCNSKVKISKSKFQSTARIILVEDGGTEHKVTIYGEVFKTYLTSLRRIPGNEKVFELSDLLLVSLLLTCTRKRLYVLQHMQLNDGVQ